MVMLVTLATKMMDEDKAPHGRLGYCALTNAGYSRNKPPADINAALTEINGNSCNFGTKNFLRLGYLARDFIRTSRPVQPDRNNNAPIGIVFNSYVRRGWTTYPEGCLQDGFQPLYDKLARHGNPAWGGVEANVGAGNAFVRSHDWETYLAWHYNHGAKLVGINTGATEPSLMAAAVRAAFSDQAMLGLSEVLVRRHSQGGPPACQRVFNAALTAKNSDHSSTIAPLGAALSPSGSCSIPHDEA